MKKYERSKLKGNTLTEMLRQAPQKIWKQSQQASQTFQFCDRLKEKFSKQQLNHYHLIETQIYEIFKYTKTQLSRMSSHRLKVLIQSIQQQCDELQKFCRSLNLIIIYNLFDRLKSCLVGICSYLLCTTTAKQNKKKDMLNLHQNYPYEVKHCHEEKSKNSSKGNLKEIQSNNICRFGGVSLYNENYERYMDRGQTFLDMLGLNQDAQKKKWEELQQIQQLAQKKNDKNFQQISEHKQKILKLDEIHRELFFPIFQQNDSDNYQVVNGLDRLQRVHKQQKDMSISNLLMFMSKKQKKYQEEKKILQKTIQNKQEEIAQYINIRNRFNSKVSVQIQTESDWELVRLKKKNEILFRQLQDSEQLKETLNQVIRKKNQQFLNSKKNQIDLQCIIQRHVKESLLSKKQIALAKEKVNILKSIISHNNSNGNQPTHAFIKVTPTIKSIDKYFETMTVSNIAKNGSDDQNQAGNKQCEKLEERQQEIQQENNKNAESVMYTKSQKLIKNITSKLIRIPKFKSVRFLQNSPSNNRANNSFKNMYANKNNISSKSNSFSLKNKKNVEANDKNISIKVVPEHILEQKTIQAKMSDKNKQPIKIQQKEQKNHVGWQNKQKKGVNSDKKYKILQKNISASMHKQVNLEQQNTTDKLNINKNRMNTVISRDRNTNKKFSVSPPHKIQKKGITAKNFDYHHAIDNESKPEQVNNNNKTWILSKGISQSKTGSIYDRLRVKQRQQHKQNLSSEAQCNGGTMLSKQSYSRYVKFQNQDSILGATDCHNTNKQFGDGEQDADNSVHNSNMNRTQTRANVKYMLDINTSFQRIVM